MQQIGMFTRISPSLYRLGAEFVYAWLPEEGTDAAQEMAALEIYRRGGTFLYLRHPAEHHQSLLVPLTGSLLKRPALLFLDNDGDYAGHWRMQEWYLKDDRMEQVGIAAVYGFRVFVPRDCKVKAGTEGLSFEQVRFGKRELEECESGFFSWDGGFRFLIHGSGHFWQEAQIRYELDGYDPLTKRLLTVPCVTGEPQWAAADSIRAEIFWNVHKETLLAAPDGMDIRMTGFPPVRMETLSFQFARGTEEYFLAPFGSGAFLAGADVPMGQKGFFRIRAGDKLEMRIEAEGYLGRRELRAEVSMLRIHAPFYAAKLEMVAAAPVPVLPLKEDRGREEAQRLLRRKLQEGCRLAYHRDISFYAEKFELCVCGRDILWFTLYGTERRLPGIALCQTQAALSQALLADEFFVVLDAKDSGSFTIPYTIDPAGLDRAKQMGYPAEECKRLAHFYPKGQIFLSEDAFRRGINKAACSYGREIQDACHHFRITEAGRDHHFPPGIWEAEEIFLVVKKGKSSSVTELAKDAERWSLWREEKESVQRILIQTCGEAQGTLWEPVFAGREWEGSIVIYGKEQPGGQKRFLVLQDEIRRPSET